MSCFPLSLKCFSSDSDNCPDVGIRPLLQFPHLLRAGPVLPTLLFFPLVPSSYRVLRGSIYSFLLLRSSCVLSAGVLHALLCLKVYCWCFHEIDVLHVHLLFLHLVLPHLQLLQPLTVLAGYACPLCSHHGKSSPLFPSHLLHPEKCMDLFKLCFFLDLCPEVGLFEHMAVLFSFLRNYSS